MSRARAPVLVAALVMVVWGASPAMTKIAARDLSSLEVGVLRTLLAGLVAAPIVLATRERLPVTGRHRWLLLVSAISGFVAFPILYSIGQGRTSAMHGNMILAALPIFTGGYAALLDRRRPSRAWIAGSAVALAGESVLVAVRSGDGGAAASYGGDALVVGAAMIVAFGYVAGARLGQGDYRALAATYWGVIIAGIIMLPVLAGTIAVDGLPSAGLESWGAIAWMAVVTSIVGYIGWYWALARGGIQRIATIQFLQPFSGLLIAAWLLGERFTVPLVLASSVILAGVTITQRR
jgi:drug/metabolite transporter (DMT)-like permease